MIISTGKINEQATKEKFDKQGDQIQTPSFTSINGWITLLRILRSVF